MTWKMLPYRHNLNTTIFSTLICKFHATHAHTKFWYRPNTYRQCNLIFVMFEFGISAHPFHRRMGFGFDEIVEILGGVDWIENA